MRKISVNIIVREGEMARKKVFIISSEELQVSDFGETLDEAIKNFRKSANLFLDAYPERRSELIKEAEKEIAPPLISKIFL